MLTVSDARGKPYLIVVTRTNSSRLVIAEASTFAEAQMLAARFREYLEDCASIAAECVRQIREPRPRKPKEPPRFACRHCGPTNYLIREGSGLCLKCHAKPSIRGRYVASQELRDRVLSYAVPEQESV